MNCIRVNFLKVKDSVMKKICYFFCFFVFISNVCYAKINCIVSILPVKFFVDKIGREYVNAHVLIPPGTNPTTYDPKPKDIIYIKKSEVYFNIGVPFEKIWTKKIKNMNPNLKIIELYKDVKRIPMANRYKDTKFNKIYTSKDFLDPHIWLSPTYVRFILLEIRDFFIQKDRKNKNYYLHNYFDFIKQIDKLESNLIVLFSNVKTRYFLVFHPSWGYFARDFGLIQVPIELEGKEPSFREILSLISFARKKQIKVVFVQPQFSKRIAKIIASKLNGRIEEIDPLAYNWIDNLRTVGIKISESLIRGTK